MVIHESTTAFGSWGEHRQRAILVAPATVRRGPRWEVLVNEVYLKAFPPDLFGEYEAFVGQPGEVMKQETRTRITRVPGSGSVDFVLKTYGYSAPRNMYTWRVESKAQAEFHGLAYCRTLGVPAVEPVACGTLRTRGGLVRTCFLMTRHLSDAVSLRDWLKEGLANEMAGKDKVGVLLREVGEHLRALHESGFFLYSCSTKDILIRDEGERLDWTLLDLPYARFAEGREARRGQRRDLGALAGTVSKYAGEAVLEGLFEGYFPDPLGGSEAGLQKRAIRGGRVHNHETVLERVRRGTERGLLRALGRR